jgi:hypothetical protein
MKPVTAILTLLAIFTLPLMAQAPRGTLPRSAPDRYAAHAEAGGASLGASLLTSKQIHNLFTTDLTRCCRVVEVALYPAQDKAMEVSVDDFVLRLSSTNKSVKSSRPEVVAAQMQQLRGTETASGGINANVGAQVGTMSGIDPITGRPVHGVETGQRVEVGNSRSETSTASTDRERQAMEMELNEKALPDDPVTAPVAGYLYFTLAKDNKKASHELEYILNGQKVTLKLD